MKAAPFPQLQAFLAVARLRSFSSAARELGVSRSAVSYSVRQLEDRLRVVLLTRTTRSVSLTDAGRRLVETAGPGLGQALAALANAAAQPGEAVGRLVAAGRRTRCADPVRIAALDCPIARVHAPAWTCGSRPREWRRPS